ncbi:MAG: hypothetical protein M5U35_09615 [Roseovarius sp.]|nr:hypothetical protein [Roseovarius sp.]
MRWERDGRLWFDALPAREWVLFYFGKTALRTPGLDYATVSGEFPEAVERRDLVVKVRLHDQAEAGAMATFINANLGALQLLQPIRFIRPRPEGMRPPGWARMRPPWGGRAHARPASGPDGVNSTECGIHRRHIATEDPKTLPLRNPGLGLQHRLPA